MTTSPTDIGSTLIEFITDELLSDRSGLSLGVQDDLLGSGLVDSMGVMRLIQFIEKRFGLCVPPADVTIENFGMVAAMETYLRGRGV